MFKVDIKDTGVISVDIIGIALVFLLSRVQSYNSKFWQSVPSHPNIMSEIHIAKPYGFLAA